MSYQVLARKWRPGNFTDLVGQEHVLKPLTHALDNERLHHAYLFTGTRGVGKTTLARILARCLNCEQGITSRPCGICQACTEIAEGRFIDLIEVDAASRTKVEDTRELLENVQYAPSRGRFKIYLIDEVHMLSGHSFNALLKTLEEPPPHVKFLLATTDPQKLPITILSRCLQFNLKNLSPLQIEEYLEEILKRENLKAESAALWQLAMAAQGSMRDALTLLDQAISFCEGHVTAAGVSDMLGTPDQSVVFRLLECLAERDTAALLNAVREVAEKAPDFQQLLEALSGILHRLAIAQALPDAIDNSHGDREQIVEFAGRFSAEDIQLFYQIALKGRSDLALAFDTRAMFEMLLIRMLVFSPEGVPTVPQKKKPQAPRVMPEREVAAPSTLETLDEAGWRALCRSLNPGGITGNILTNCVVTEIGKGSLKLCLDETQSAVFGEEHRSRIEQLFSGHFGQPLAVDIRVGRPSGESPAAFNQRIRREQLERLRTGFQQDPNVRQLVETFSGQVVVDSISPIKQ
jgi:DNA polymerase-3 subunit gamma/tau